MSQFSHAAVTAAGKLGTRALLTLTAVAGAVLNSPNERIKQQYMSWLWNLLLSPVGRALVKLNSTDVEDAEELCLTEVTASPWLFCMKSVLGRNSAHESNLQCFLTTYA